MILLRPDCLVFKTSDGESIPCSAHDVTVELIGDSAEWLDTDLIAHAAEAVLHYFRAEKGKESVSVAEFSEALERVLRGLGIDVKTSGQPADPAATNSDKPAPRIVDADLRELVGESNVGGELLFFPRLRETIRRELDGTPMIIRFTGLRDCVKRLTGAKRWSAHCQSLNDQIVDYLRNCLGSERTGERCALVVY